MKITLRILFFECNGNSYVLFLVHCLSVCCMFIRSLNRQFKQFKQHYIPTLLPYYAYFMGMRPAIYFEIGVFSPCHFNVLS